MRKLILTNHQSPGDIVMLTAAVRDLHAAYPGQFLTDVRTPCPALWENNPHLTPLDPADRDVEVIGCEYPLIDRSNQEPWHFLHAFIDFLNGRLGVSIRPTAFKGDIHLSPQEKGWRGQVEELVGERAPYWVVNAGGKFDFTIKWWDTKRYQAVVDHFQDQILFVQVGEQGHNHPGLDGVIDLRGRTDLRQLVRLVHHADGVLSGVSLAMHLAAAVETHAGAPRNRPCVVVAGGREPPHWEAYPHHQFIHSVGALACCDDGGCWKARTAPLGDGDARDLPHNLCVDVVGGLPRCMDIIEPADVIDRIDRYYRGGALKRAARPPVAARPAAAKAQDRLFECDTPAMGLVIGTYGSLAHVHLQLEAWRRNCRDVPVLVHDDCSPRQDALRALCERYGAAFHSTTERHGQDMGDLRVYVDGLEWAGDRGVELLVKFSRRFVPVVEWQAELGRLAFESQYATFSAPCRTYGFGFRTEAMALHVGRWKASNGLEDIERRLRTRAYELVEALVHQGAMKVHRDACEANRAYEAARPARSDCQGYGLWPLLGEDKRQPSPRFLWHETCSQMEYLRSAAQYGLTNYSKADFAKEG